MHTSTRPLLFPGTLKAGLWALLVLLAVGCASGPRYGAAKRKKKSCDCPHWNRLTDPAQDVRAQAIPLRSRTEHAERD